MGAIGGFGGIQFGTNFATQPSFITFPLPSLSGAAIMPSAVNLYVNNTLISQNHVAAGPFTINNIPIVTGEGNLNVVTTDLLGRQQISSMPFYASNELLQPGLQDYSYEAGFIRENFGTVSNDYGRFMMSGTDNIGVTPQFTSQFHAEFLKNQESVGVGGNYLYRNYGVFNAAIAQSYNTKQKLGTLAVLGFQHQSYCAVSYGVNAQIASRQFTDIGIQSGQAAPSLQSQVFVGMPLRNGASLGVSYTLQNNRCGQPNASLLNASYTQTYHQTWSLSLSGITNVGGDNNKSVFLVLTKVLGERTTASVNAASQYGNNLQNINQGYLQVAQSLPLGNGYGYSVQAGMGQGQPQNYQASVSAQNNIGTYSAAAGLQDGQRGYRLEASGGAAELGGNTYLSRELTSSFGVVQVPGYPDVDVYAFNQPIGRTNHQGNLLVPNLLPYQDNPISIEPNDLPLDAQVGTTELNAVPYYRSGVLLRFPVKPAHGATMTLVLPSGEAVPAGATANILGQDNKFPVGSDGELYVTGLTVPNTNIIQAHWEGGSCVASVNYTERLGPLPNLGTIVCQ